MYCSFFGRIFLGGERWLFWLSVLIILNGFLHWKLIGFDHDLVKILMVNNIPLGASPLISLTGPHSKDLTFSIFRYMKDSSSTPSLRALKFNWRIKSSKKSSSSTKYVLFRHFFTPPGNVKPYKSLFFLQSFITNRWPLQPKVVMDFVNAPLLRVPNHPLIQRTVLYF